MNGFPDTSGDAGTSATPDLRTDGGDLPPVVVKLGGARAVDPAGAVGDVAHLVANGRKVVVVHGGSTEVDDTLEALGREPEYVETPGGVTGRFTDEDTMEVFEMALPGKLNTELVVGLRNAGVDALGVSGVDGGLLTGPRKSAVRVLEDGKRKIKRGDHSGRIESVNDALLESLLADGYTPVLSPPMLGAEDDGDHTAVNTDADRAAAAVAGALGAELVVLTDVAGVYADPDDPDTLIDGVDSPAGFEDLEAAAEGFMTRKVMAAEEALEGGATAVYVSDANVRDPIIAALDGAGTRVDRTAVVGSTSGDGGDATVVDDSNGDGDDTGVHDGQDADTGGVEQ